MIACVDAMRDVVAQDFLLDAAQRRAHRADLRDDVDAVAVVLDHAREAAHLALDAVEPFPSVAVLLFFAMRSIYPLGVSKARAADTTAKVNTSSAMTTTAEHTTIITTRRPKAASIDPVCGMTVDPKAGKPHADYQGTDLLFLLATPSIRRLRATYYFCADCRSKFIADPRNISASRSVEGAIYTCPMHPEIRQVGPGACPICGMALEPEIATADSGPNPELADMTRRFWIGLALAVPVMVLEMGGHFVGAHIGSTPTLSN